MISLQATTHVLQLLYLCLPVILPSLFLADLNPQATILHTIRFLSFFFSCLHAFFWATVSLSAQTQYGSL